MMGDRCFPPKFNNLETDTEKDPSDQTTDLEASSLMSILLKENVVNCSFKVDNTTVLLTSHLKMVRNSR